jgi:hypothetical protein
MLEAILFIVVHADTGIQQNVGVAETEISFDFCLNAF